MSDYAKRPPEMAREVATLQERALETEREGGPPVVLATYIRLQAGLATYAEWRDRAFAEGLAWLTPDSSASARSQQERWSGGFNQRGGEAFRMLIDQVSRDEELIEQTFELMAMQESMAYSTIGTMPLAGFMGQVREHLRDFERFRKDLDDRWNELIGQNERIHEQIAALRKQVLEMFKQSVGEARGWAPKIESAVGAVLFAWEKEEEPSPDPSLAPVVKTAFDTIHQLQKTVDDITKSALGLYANEQTIHTMFGNSRQQLKEYLDRVNRKTVDRAWVDACTASADAANKCPKDGQKEDARAFADRAGDESEWLVKQFNSEFDDFYKHFEGRFTGDVSDKTTEALAEAEFFNQFWRDVESLNLPGEFGTAADQIARCENVSLDRLTDDQRSRFKAIIHERVSAIEEKVRDLDSSFLERFKLHFIDVPRQQAIDRLKRLVGYKGMTETLTVKLGTDLRSGIQTDGQIETEPRGFRVTWIEWDSDFRRNLRINDLIVGVNGQSLAAFLQPGQMGKGVGQHAESSYWTDIGAKPDEMITLSVLRDGEPLTVDGRLHLDYFYYDTQGKPALAPGGPARLANDGFDGAWSFWLEEFVKRLSQHFSAGWTQRSYNSRNELAWYVEQQPRVDYLLANHPGPFAAAIRDDWTRGMELARGKKAELGPKELEYRTIGEKRIEMAKVAAAAAWQAALRQYASEMMPAFPAPDVLAREAAIGKVVELPAITSRNFLNDLGRSFAALGSPSDGYYFILFDNPAFRDIYGVISRYRGQLNPRVDERFRFIARVLDDPQMFTVNGRSVMGLTVAPLAALAGQDEVFVDLSTRPPRFAGEDALSSFTAIVRDDTSPASVVQAMLQAIKNGDDATWTSLFAPWKVLSGSGGRTIIDPSYSSDTSRFMSDWERSRRLIMGEVYDARVERVEKVRRVIEHTADNGLPNVDQSVAWVDHYGLFEGEYRTFQNVNVHRQWVLQRLDEGPWRVTSIQGL